MSETHEPQIHLVPVKTRYGGIPLEGKLFITVATYIDDSEGSHDRYQETVRHIHDVAGEGIKDDVLIGKDGTQNAFHTAEQYKSLDSLCSEHPELGKQVKSKLGEREFKEGFVFGMISHDNSLLEEFDAMGIPYHTRVMLREEVLRVPYWLSRPRPDHRNN